MTASPPAAPGMPSEEDLLRALNAGWRDGDEFDSSASIAAILSLTRPAFERVERERDEFYRDGLRAEDKWIEFEARALSAEAKLAQAVEALEPFADERNGVMQDLLWGDEPDTAIATITTRLGNIRAARAVVRSASAAARGET